MGHINHTHRKSPIILSSKFEAASFRATLNHVWTLEPSQREVLGIYCLIKTTVGELLKAIDTSHSFIDYVTYPHSEGKITCRVKFVNGSTGYLEELKDKGKESDICLVSVRMGRIKYWEHVYDLSSHERYETTTVALVLISPENIDVDRLKCYGLDGKEIG